MNTPKRKTHFYGRRIGRPLTKSKKALLEKYMPEIGLKLPDTKITPTTFFKKQYQKTTLEIGFGDGEHLHLLSQQNPDTAHIGIEPYINGVASLIGDWKETANQNIKIYDNDALPFIKNLADESLDRIYILNPDPWPKKRHHKRRIVNDENTKEYVRLLKPDGLLITATDVDDLAEWMVTVLSNNKNLEWTAETPSDWQTPPEGWITTTRYAQKGLDAGRKQTYLVFRKIKE